MLYYEEPYTKRIRAKILKKEDGKCLLDRTILYEGGGGQPADRGYVICDGKKVRIEHLGELWHRCNCNSGEEIEIELDWNFRYYMMRSHTAEHTFFRFLQERGAELIKIALGEESSIMFKGDIEIEDVLEAEEKTRELIKKGIEVKSFWISKEEVENYTELRIKKERIKGEKVRVVNIEGHDLSACKGIHVKNLREIGDFAVTKFRRGKKKEVKFVIGDKAKEFHYSMSKTLRRVAWGENIEVEKFERVFHNVLREKEIMSEALKSLSEEMDFEKENCKGVKIAYRIIPGAERKIIVRKMMEFTNTPKRIALFGDPVSHSVSCAFSEDMKHLRELAMELIKKLGGKGGGGERFISGSTPDEKKFIERIKEEICKNI